MAGEYADNVGRGAETIGDILLGAGSIQDALQRMAESLLGTAEELATGRAQQEEAGADFVNALQSFATSVSSARTAASASETTAPSPATAVQLASRGTSPEGIPTASPIVEVLEALEQRFAQVAQFMDDTLTRAMQEEDRVSFAGGFGRSEPSSPGENGEWGVIRVDELNQALAEFISALGRIEQIMEKATDIKVTVEAGDGWD